MSGEKGTRIILDKNKYLPRTISTFNIISAYVTDIYYNHLYSEAMKMKAEGKTTSITEGYRHAIWAFINAINPDSGKYKEHHYKQLLKGINEYFTVWTSFSTLNLRDCINKVTQEFVPEDYFVNLDNDQRSNIIRKVLTGSIKEFSLTVIHEYLNGIIDNHDDTANIEALKDCMTDILLMEREAMFRKFLDQNIGKKAETIDKAVGVKMQHEIKTLLSQRDAIQRQLNDCKKLLNDRDTQLLKVIDSYKKLTIRHKGLTDEYQALKTKSEAARRMPISQPDESDSDDPSPEVMEQVLRQYEKKPAEQKKVRFGKSEKKTTPVATKTQTTPTPVATKTPTNPTPVEELEIIEQPDEPEPVAFIEQPEKILEDRFKKITVPKQELGDAPKFDEFDDPF